MPILCVTNFLRTIIINRIAAAVPICVALLMPPHTAAARASYVVQVDAELQRLEVEARFDDPVDSISARSRDARRHLIWARVCDGEQPIDLRGRRMRLPADGSVCVRYAVDLVSAVKAERRNTALSSSNIIVSPAVWLWRPALNDGEHIDVRFNLGEGMEVSVPWQAIDEAANTYSLSRSPQSSTAPAVFGDFEYYEADVPGATLRISLLRTANDVVAADVIDWVRAAATNVSLVYGYFPNPSPNIVLLPVSHSWRSNSPVPFGRVIRDGGETVELFINPDKPIEDYYENWTATHEFSHLLLPYLSSRHRWISEGFAQYYQNLLLARAEQYSNERAWQKLYEGFERGRRSSPELSPNQAARSDSRNSLMKRYWSGAALAIMADVELRRRSDGEHSLDDVLRELQHCCLPADETWTGVELFTRLDAFLNEPVFMPLLRRYADAPGFPDVRPLLADLGVAVDDDAIRLIDDAPLAAIRTAMTSR